MYDFARLEVIVIKEILHKKYLNLEQFDKAKYEREIEIITYITKIRERIKQENLEKDESNRIEAYLDFANNPNKV